jgi:hypothetical protein
MFVISQKASYTWPVTVEFPTDGGKTDRQTFDAEFKRLTQTRINEIRAAIEANATTDTELAREVLVGWEGVTDGNGEAVPFSERSRDQLLDVPLVSAAVIYAWLGSLTGAKRKN